MGRKQTEETKRKISETRKKNRGKYNYPTGQDHPMFGNHHTEDTKKSISETLKSLDLSGEKAYWHGKHPSEETRQKLSEVKKGEKNHFYGKKHSNEAKKKNAEAHKGVFPSLETRLKMSESHKLSVKRGQSNHFYGKSPQAHPVSSWWGWYKQWMFRSLGELRYLIEEIEYYGLQWESAENDRYRINYVDLNGNARTYCADFVVSETKMIEVKPKRFMSDSIVLMKQEAAIKFCENNGLSYEIVESKMLPFLKLKALIENDKVQLHNMDKFEKHARSLAGHRGEWRKGMP